MSSRFQNQGQSKLAFDKGANWTQYCPALFGANFAWGEADCSKQRRAIHQVYLRHDQPLPQPIRCPSDPPPIIGALVPRAQASQIKAQLLGVVVGWAIDKFPEEQLGLFQLPTHELDKQPHTFSISSICGSLSSLWQRHQRQSLSKKRESTSWVQPLNGSIFGQIQLQGNTNLQYIRSMLSLQCQCTINIIELMSKSLKLVVRNSKPQSTIQPSTPRQCTTPILKRPSQTIDLSSKLNQLEGNLRMLQKKYRSNLKEGFDCKIKAYRLQAVVERKMLKEAIEQTQRAHQRQHIRQRFSSNDSERKVDHSRAAVAHYQREQRIKYMNLRNIREKRTISLLAHERHGQIDRHIKQSHNRIVHEQSLIHKKRDYFQFLRQASLRKQQIDLKRQILNQIVSNTQRLKDLKQTLLDLKNSQSAQQTTFLTV